MASEDKELSQINTAPYSQDVDSDEIDPETVDLANPPKKQTNVLSGVYYCNNGRDRGFLPN